jgi:lipoate-protein ligase B
MADTAAAYGVEAGPRSGQPGCWVEADGPRPRKLGALGLRVEKGVTFHGIALNVTTDLAGFALIDPCGMVDLDVTSIARERGWTGDAARPTTASVREAGERFADAFRMRLADAVVVSAAPARGRAA